MRRRRDRDSGPGAGAASSRPVDAAGRADPERQPPDVVVRAIESLRRALPPAAPDLEERILESVHRRCEPRRKRSSRRLRGDAGVNALTGLLRAQVAIPAAALTLAIVTVPAIDLERDSDAAIASVPLTRSCGSDGASRPDGQGRAGRLAGQSLVVAGTWRHEEQARFERVLERFERTTGAQVTYAYETRDIAKKLRARVARGCPPDVALLPQPGLLEDFARQHELQPLDGKTAALVRRNYNWEWRRLATFDGDMYGVWLKAANKSTFWFNRDIFGAAGVAPPRTWSGLLQVAAKLRAAGVVPFAVAGGDGWTLTDWFENVYLRTAGRAYYDALARGEIKWTHKTVRTALLRLSQILGRTQWVAGGTREAVKTKFEHSVTQVFSRNAKAAMLFEGDFVGNLLIDPSGSVATNAGTFAFPELDAADDAVVAGGDVAVQFTHNSAARELIRFLATPAAAEPWASAGGFISPNRRLDRRVYKDPVTRKLAQALVEATSVQFDLSDMQPSAFGATAERGMWKIFQRYFAAGPSSINATMRRLERGAVAARAAKAAVAEGS